MTPETDSGQFRYRLVTLWDLMRPFHAVAFLNLLEILHLLGFHKRTNIIKGTVISASHSFAQSLATLPATDSVKALLSKLKLQEPGGDSDDLGELGHIVLKHFTAIESYCIDLELVASLATVRKLKTVITKSNSRASVYQLADELKGRLTDELESKCFWALTTREREYYEQPKNGWGEVIIRFPDSVTDVEEASKCFALSRYAASVFHSTQVVEVGLIELGTYIGVNDPRSGWTAVANKLTAIIKKAHGDRTDFEKQNFDFLEQMHGTIEALKNAWRNKIGHAQGRLTLMDKDFTPEIAEEILFASRAFMRRLADGLPLL